MDIFPGGAASSRRRRVLERDSPPPVEWHAKGFGGAPTRLLQDGVVGSDIGTKNLPKQSASTERS
jgi:hypothetical protein